MRENRLRSETHVDAHHHISVEQKFFEAESGIHFHDFFELEIILDGHGKQMLNGLEYELKRGCVYLLTPADFHNVICEERLELVNVSFDEGLLFPAFSDLFLRNRRNICFSVDDKTFSKMTQVTALLSQELADRSDDSDSGIRMLAEYLLLLFHRSIPTELRERDADPAFSDTALRYLYMHFRENPRLEDVAQLCGYAPNYFGRLFLRLTGKSYSDFLNTLKLNHAKMLLSSTTMTAAEIAFSCGFTSLSNFYRVFHAAVGEAPLDYRTSLRKP